MTPELEESAVSKRDECTLRDSHRKFRDYRRLREESPRLNRLFPVPSVSVTQGTSMRFRQYLFGTREYSTELEPIVARMALCTEAARGRDWTSGEEEYIKLVKSVCSQLPLFQYHVGARMALIDSIESMLDALYLRIKG